MKIATLFFAALALLIACGPSSPSEDSMQESPHLLNDIPAFTPDSLVNMVIEIPAGTNQKWEVNKKTGQIEWQELGPDSFRIVDYLPYPANYGFIPQTLLPKEKGGDGDPLDVYLLGPTVPRASVVPVRIIGVIYALDRGEQDSKLLAVAADGPFSHINTYEEWTTQVPGSIEIIQTWLTNYKGADLMKIQSTGDEQEAMRMVRTAQQAF